MNEMRKTRAIWSAAEMYILRGKGIDIGCGGDPVMPDAMGFDVKDGDANFISKHVHEQFDYVFSSHCLEHMTDPHNALFEWWKLVKPGGYMFVIVPDEDLYEQGHWPSKYNPDHRFTFTIAKHRSWSPKSVNVLETCMDYVGYKGADLIDLCLQDHGYDRNIKGVDQTHSDALAQIQFILRKRE